MQHGRVSHDERTRSFQALHDMIAQHHLHPEDHYEIAALLESNGWNDARVQKEFGFVSVFELARQLWNMDNHQLAFSANEFVAEEPIWSKFGDHVRQFLRGMIFALPMALSIASMIVLRFSLWSYQYLSVKLATSIAIGTILSFWTVGGFMQSIARRGFFYIFQGYYRLARQMTFRYISFGVLTSVTISLLMFVLNMLFPIFPNEMLGIIIVYYFVLNIIWLSVTAMYILKKEIVFTGLVTLGIGFIYVGFDVLHMNILVTQVISMVIISILSLLLVARLFRREQTAKERTINPSLPRRGFTLYTVIPYFSYGFLYFCLLFIDRIMAWSTHSDSMQYIIWFRGDYEVGLDFSLLTLMIPMGVSEVIVSRIMNGTLFHQRQFYGWQAEEMNRLYVSKYNISLLLMGLISVLSSIAVYLSVKWLMDTYVLRQNQQILDTVNSNFVFVVGLISYSILAIALLNSVLMFSLSRPELVIRPLILSIAVNLLVGFLCSRWFQYTDAVWGLAAGSLLFMVMTTRNARKVLSSLDYHLYLLS